MNVDENGKEGGVQIGDLVRLASVGQWQTPPFVMGNIFQGAPPILLLQKIHFLSLYSLNVILFYNGATIISICTVASDFSHWNWMMHYGDD